MKQLLFLAGIIFTFTTTDAQTWQWSRRGGSDTDPFSRNSYNAEQVYDMASDRNGNLYFVSVVINDGPTLSNGPGAPYTVFSGYGNTGYPHSNLLLASYNCNGVLRWKKVIGGDGGVIATSLRTDTFGHVYLMGTASVVQYNPNQVPTPVRTHFDSDTTLPYDLLKNLFLAQYDTSGNFKWLRMPDPDTLTYYGAFPKSGGFDIGVDGAGNLNMLCWLGEGSLPNTPYTVSSPGLFVVKYNPQGSVVSVIHPPGMNLTARTNITPIFNGTPTVGFDNIRMAVAPNGNWTVAGNVSYQAGPGFSINGQQVLYSAFAATFNAQWQHIWRYISDSAFTGINARPVTDAASNVYITGSTFDNALLFGDTVHAARYHSVPFVAKVSATGVTQWISNASSISALGGCRASTRGEAIALTPGGEVVITGGYGGITWGSHQIGRSCNTGYGVYLARVDAATGTCTGFDTIRTPNTPGNWGTALANAKGNSLYVGGRMCSSQYPSNDTLYIAGGSDDFFVCRWGYGCTCTTLPAASFTSRNTAAQTIQFTYTGTTTSIDSIVWNFGDGQRQKLTSGYTIPFTHSYAAAGRYQATVTVYGSCGSNTYSQTYPLGLTNTSALTEIRVYPNPASEYLTVEGAGGTTAILYNTLGAQLVQKNITSNMQQFDISRFPVGVYMLQLKDADGAQRMIRVLKR